jgi:hypothetical protein
MAQLKGEIENGRGNLAQLWSALRSKDAELAARDAQLQDRDRELVRCREEIRALKSESAQQDRNEQAT